MVTKLYRPLDRNKNEIRLLSFRPSASRSCQIHLESRHVSLRNPPAYQALSYAWGAEPATYRLTVNGKTVMIRPNPHAALRQLSHKKSKKKRFSLWCDALCSNQEDIDERNHQVLRMGDIYRNAHRTLIWLGEEEDNSDLAFSYLCHWSDVGLEAVNKGFGEAFRQLDPMLLDPHGCKAMEDLFMRPWWRRIWVIQEVLLSDSILLLCGNRRCSWARYLLAGMAMREAIQGVSLNYRSADQFAAIAFIVVSISDSLFL